MQRRGGQRLPRAPGASARLALRPPDPLTTLPARLSRVSVAPRAAAAPPPASEEAGDGWGLDDEVLEAGVLVVGNLNAPPAVTFSAVIYALRCMLKEDIPLNQGCLAPISIRIPAGCVLSPGPEAAVVGGNVLTSQRVTDVVLRAFRACADSQGCMNNPPPRVLRSRRPVSARLSLPRAARPPPAAAVHRALRCPGSAG